MTLQPALFALALVVSLGACEKTVKVQSYRARATCEYANDGSCRVDLGLTGTTTNCWCST